MRCCSRRSISSGLLIAALAVPPGATPARADIAGEQVVSGDVTFEQQGDVTTIHASDGAIIHYDQFDVWANEELHFVQPDSSSRVLNRVFGDATHIDGGLFANGIVYIVNPAGIFFGGNAVVDVAGLVAAAGNISNEDFLAGTDHFEPTGPVSNAGQIDAGSVALLGLSVANHGSIRAPDGTIALVAGEQVVLTRLGGHLYVEVEGVAGAADTPAIEQTGTIDAGAGDVSFITGDVYSLAMNHEGITRGRTIELRAASGTVSVAGLLDASDRSAGATGGSIAVTGERVALLGAELDASGDAGGGTIRVGGDLRGEGALPTARRTYVDENSALRAGAITSGDGGRVIVWADEATSFHGALSARGGAAGGDGGFAEISGAVFLFSDGDVDLRAVSGTNGTLLYDPKDIVIAGGTGDGLDDEDVDAGELDQIGRDAGQILFGDADELATPFTIFESEIEGTDANIVLQATNSITTSGAGTFTNDSGEGVDVIRITDGNSLTLTTRNAAGDATGGAAAPGIDLTGISVQTVGGSVTHSTGDGDIAVAGITTSGADGVDGGAAGSISLLAGDLDMQRDSDVTVTGNLVARGGAGSAGAGGAGGAVVVRSDGVNAPFPNGSPAQVIAGGGDLSLAAVDTRGGAGTTSGGRGGNVRIETTDGAIAAGAVDASGGAGGTTGGGAGQIIVLTRDADMDNANSIAVGDLRAVGGTGTAEAGGAGAFIDVRTQASVRVVEQGNPLNVLQEAAGGGDVTIASMDSSGGDGGTQGGNAGTSGLFSPVSIRATASGDGNVLNVAGTIAAQGGDGSDGNGGSGARVELTTGDGDLSAGAIVTAGGAGAIGAGGVGGNVAVTTTDGSIAIASVDTSGGAGGTSGGRAGSFTATARGADNTLAVAGAITTRGGSGGSEAAAVGATNDGGAGGSVTLQVQDSDLTIASAIDTRGGDAGVNDANDALGGSGGGILLEAGFTEDDQGSILLQANLNAREGVSGANAATTRAASLQLRDGGDVSIVAADDLEHTGQAGPHVTTTGDVRLEAGGDLGQANGAFLVEGSGERRPDANGSGDFVDHDALTVVAGGAADVQVVGGVGGAFLRELNATATSPTADISVTQPGAAGVDVIEMAGVAGEMVVTRVDTTVNRVDVTIALENPDEDTPDAALVFATGSVTAGGAFTGDSHGDIVLGDTDGIVITASAVPAPDAMPGDPIVAGNVVLLAGNDTDGTGAIRDAPGGATGRIDLLGDADDPGHLILAARQGIGTAGDPIVTQGGGRLSALTVPLKNDGTVDPLADADIFVRNTDSGDLAIVFEDTTFNGVRVANGTGDIQIANDVGDITVDDAVVRTRPVNSDDGTGGDVTFTVNPGSRIVLDPRSTIASGGVQIYDGGVALVRDTTIVADGGFELRGALDTDASALAEAGFSATVDGTSTSRVEGAVGANRALEFFALSSGDAATPDLVLDTPSITTTTSQTFRADLALAQHVAFNAGAAVEFAGDVSATSPVAGLAVSTPARILFSGTGDQSVTTQGGGISLDAAGSGAAIPAEATIAKTGGDLSLATTGDLILGDGDKLSVAGNLDLAGATVRFTDLSALDISVTSADTQVFARTPGLVTLADGRQISDGGTDILANTVAFSADPTVDGNGPAPRIATASGTAVNAGPISVATLPAAIAASDIDSARGVLDLAIPTSDPGHETPEQGDVVEAPLELYASQDRAAPGAPLSSAEVVAFLACAPVGDRDAPPGCAPAAEAPYGSALDTERAVEVARAYRELLGDSDRARAGRESLARAAADRDAWLPGASSPAGRVYLAEIARVLAQTRMLGLGATTYGEVRGELLAALIAAIGSPELDAARLAAAVEASAAGMPI